MLELRLWLSQVIANFEELSSLEFQRAHWVEGENPNIVATFEEAVCGLGDFAFDQLIPLLRAKNLATDHESALMSSYHSALREFSQYWWKQGGDPRAVLTDPKWALLVSQATTIRTALARALDQYSGDD